MSFLQFQNYPLWLNLTIFAGVSAVTWFGGVKLEKYTDALAEKTGLGRAFLGLLLLSTITSLPDVSTTVTALWAGNRDLALFNLLGSIAIQCTILAVADLLIQSGPLTEFTPSYALITQGVGLVLLIAIALSGMSIAGSVANQLHSNSRLLSIGLGPGIAFIIYLVVLYLTYKAQGYPRWLPAEASQAPGDSPKEKEETFLDQKEEQHTPEEKERHQEAEKESQEIQNRPNTLLIFGLVSFGLVVLVAGAALALLGDAISKQTGLGAGFIGMTLVSTATSLPEVSTTFVAVRAGNYDLAVSNIFGSNAFDIALLLPAAIIFQGVLFKDLSPAAFFVTVLGLMMTAIYLLGMLEHGDHTILRMGWDSFIVAILFLVGLAGLFFLK